MQNKKQWDKDGIFSVLNYLENIEPRCNSCDHCYFYINEKQCFKQQEKIKEEHQKWEQKVKKWKERLNNAE